MTQKKKLLVLGGSGFVGKSIIEYIKLKKLSKHKINELITISRSNISKDFNTNRIKFTFIKKDLIKLKKIPEVDYIIYCLRSDNVKKSDKHFNHFLKLIRKYKKKPKILFTSSGAVYGNRLYKKSDKQVEFSENDIINLEKIKKLDKKKIKYALEKVHIEKKFHNLGKKNYKVSIARCFNFIGKEMAYSDQAVGSLMRDVIKNKSIIKLKTTMNVYRGYLNDIDMVNWLLTIIHYSNYNCPIFNVGSNKSINVRTLAKLIGKTYKKKVLLKKLKNKTCDCYVPSINKAKRLLKLKDSINLNKSINLIRTYKYEKNFYSNTDI